MVELYVILASTSKYENNSSGKHSGNTVSKISRVKYSVVGNLGGHADNFSLSVHCTVSQFTLLASTKKGNKPDFHEAAGGSQARDLYDHFVTKVQELYGPERVKNGVFQAMMQVGLVNDGSWHCAQLSLPSTHLFCRSGKRRISQYRCRST